MEIKQNPFSVYDFLGYFIPGATLSYIAIISFSHAKISIPAFPNNISSLESLLPFTLLSYLIGHVLSYISSATIEKYSLYTYGYPSRYLLRDKNSKEQQKKTTMFWKALNTTFILPIYIFDKIINKLLNLRYFITRPLDKNLTIIIRAKIYSLLSEHNQNNFSTGPDETHYFTFVYHHTVENCPAHLPKMQNYVALYGFLRANSLIFNICFWASALHLKLEQNFFTTNKIALISMVAFGFLSFILYLGFMKFYRRFTMESLMAFAVTYKPPTVLTSEN